MEQELDEGEEAFPPATILLVDDHRANLLALQAVLEPLGHKMVLAESAVIALRLLGNHEFAVIVTDVRMPDLDGFDLVTKLRARTAAPVVMMSAVYDDRETVQRAYSLGAVDFIAKPFDADLLRWRVGALVSLYRRGEELKRRAALIARKEREAAAAQEAASKATAAAEVAARRLQEKDQLVGILGHDLRNPLNTILLSCQSLARSADIGPRHRGVAERGVRAAERMGAMIQDILDFARASSASTFPIRLRSADFSAVASMVVDEIQPAHPDRPITLRSSGDLRTECDPERLAQALSNLVMNAIQHGQGPVSVQIGIEAEWVVMSIHNAGEPIPAEALDSLFEPFKRVSRSSTGLGLGLHIVREIVRAHGGTVTVESTRGAGTTFRASWPARRPESRSTPGAEQPSA